MEENNYTWCQFCGEKIVEGASVCKHCHREQLSEKQIRKKTDKILFDRLGIPSLIVFLLFFEKWWLGVIGVIVLFIVVSYRKINIEENWKILDIVNKYDKIKRREKRNSIISTIILTIVVAILLLTNPDKNDFNAYIRNSISKVVSKETNLSSSVSSLLVDKISEALPSELDYFIYRDNYYLFSIYTIDPSITNYSTQPKLVFLGILNHFFIV